MNVRVAVVDDEAPARDRLVKYLEQEPNLEIVGQCANGPEAIECIRELQPDLVFLDVQMPEVSGFDVLRALPEDCLPAVVFVTAHDRHAVEAFEFHAMDYLLKPFTRARLQESLRRARARLKDPPQVRAEQIAALARVNESSTPYLNRFAVKDGNQTLFVKTQDVDYIEAAANYAVLHTRNGNHVLRETLRNLYSLLSPAMFLRISRSLIVSLDRIKAIRSSGPGEWLVILQDGRELPMTRGLREVQERLQYSGGRTSADLQ